MTGDGIHCITTVIVIVTISCSSVTLGICYVNVKIKSTVDSSFTRILVYNAEIQLDQTDCLTFYSDWLSEFAQQC